VIGAITITQGRLRPAPPPEDGNFDSIFPPAGIDRWKLTEETAREQGDTSCFASHITDNPHPNKGEER